MTLLGHLFPKHWFNTYADTLLNVFLAIFLLHVPPVVSLYIDAASAADCCMRDLTKWSLWEANDVCVVGGRDVFNCSFARLIYTLS